jgi:glyoxylase-like metal-dependent hydrolase (beta-lactamase superfamily II)
MLLQFRLLVMGGMMQRERVAENVYWFQSYEYAQVTSGVVVGPEWAVMIDTLAFPEETLGIRDFVEQELSVPVRYVILTHYHADHSWGACFFPGATVIAHQKCRRLLEERGKPSLEEVRKEHPNFRQVKIVLPHLTLDEGSIALRVGKKTLRMIPLPGHSVDQLGVLVEEDRVLFAGDVFMSLPYIVDGDYEDTVASLKLINKMGLENVVQGHGEVVLRGEIDVVVKSNLAYLSAIRKAVRKASRRKYPRDLLDTVDVESCGKSRVLIGGLAEELHHRNLIALYRQMYGESPKSSPKEDYD